jgi:hypothetical protein
VEDPFGIFPESSESITRWLQEMSMIKWEEGLSAESQNHLSEDDRGGDRGDLGGIIIRGQLHNIKANDTKGSKFFKKGDEFVKCEATWLRRPHTWKKARIEEVQVEADIDGLLSKAFHHRSHGVPVAGNDGSDPLRIVKFLPGARPDPDLHKTSFWQWAEDLSHDGAVRKGFAEVFLPQIRVSIQMEEMEMWMDPEHFRHRIRRTPCRIKSRATSFSPKGNSRFPIS